jgi:ABC-2 type transport system permease protein
MKALRAYWNVIWVLWRRDLLHYWRNRVRAVVGLTMPMIWLFVFGGGMSASFSRGAENFSQLGVAYTQFIFPGVIAMSLIFNAIFSALDTVKDKEFGFLKEILVAPVPRSTIVFGRSLGAASTAAIQAILILLFAPFVGVNLSAVTILALIPTIWIVALSLAAIGILLAAAFDNQEGFQFVVNFVNMPMFFLSGALFPLAQLPGWMEVLVRLNPASYAVDALRRIVLHGQHLPDAVIDQLSFTVFGQSLSITADVVVLLVFSGILIVIAAQRFSRPR